MTKTNGTADTAGELAQVQGAYLNAMRSVAQGVKLLQSDLLELAEATRDMRRLGKFVTDYPQALDAACNATLRGWGYTANGREALGMSPPPTQAELNLVMARTNLAAAEERLAAARAIECVTDSMVYDRRQRIQAAAESVIRHRKVVAALEPSTAATFKTWLKAFARDVRAVMAESPAIPRPGWDAINQREQEEAAREAAKYDPLGAMIANELASGE